MIKKIAVISNSCPPLNGSGIGNAHYNLYKMLLKQGYDTRIYTYGDLPEQIKKIGVERNIFRNGNSRFINRLIDIFLTINYKFERWILRKKKITGLAYQFPIAIHTILASWKLNKHLKLFKPDIVIIPDMGAPGYSIKKNKNSIHIHISHHNPVRFLYNPLIITHDYADAFKAIYLEQSSLNKIDAVICPSNYMKDVFLKTFKFEKNINVIPNIVDNEYINSIKEKDLRKIMDVKDDTPVIFIPSAGSKIKGAQYIIEILRRINKELDSRVAFYLNSDLSEAQDFELKNLNIKYFAPGQIDNISNIGFLKSCSICISPTLVENFSMALLEVMFCGIPCISFNIGGNSDLINSGETGFLVPYLDIEKLLEKSLILLRDDELYRTFKLNINKKINNEFSSQRVINQYINFFNLLLSNKSFNKPN